MKLQLVLISGLLLAVGIKHGEGQNVKNPTIRNRIDSYGLIQRDSLGAKLPRVATPDSIQLQNPCKNFNMPIIKNESFRHNMPLMSIPDSIKFSMPIVGQDTSCWNAGNPDK